MALVELEEAPWGEIRGKPITPLKLARLLLPHRVKSKQVRISGTTTLKGYAKEDFFEAWARNLPPPIDNETSDTSATDGAISAAAVAAVWARQERSEFP